MENYLMLNGKRVDLTDEQIEKLGLKIEKEDCFKRLGDIYFRIMDTGNIEWVQDHFKPWDDERYKIANYCTDKSLMQQRAYHETLNRLLWRFSMQNDGDKIDWEDVNQAKYFIVAEDNSNETFSIQHIVMLKSQDIYIYSEAIAKRAIGEIIFPFIYEHPDFVW